MTNQLLFLTLTLLTAAVLAVPLAQKIGLGSILGYLIAGAVIGPFGAKLLTDGSELLHFSEFGVVFLLFVIGLELKPARLWVMRRSVFGLGGLQVLVTTAVFFAALCLLHFDTVTALVLAFAFSLSSTAFALQYLSERKQINTEYGRSAFAILLFQDVAVIPALAILPIVFTGIGEKSLLPPWVGVLVVITILALGRKITNPIFRLIAASRSREVFTAATLLLVLGVAALMQTVGLSMALGSFLVGVLLSDSEYRHELETDIEPFKGILLGLFFMSVGMMVNIHLMIAKPLTVLMMLLGYICLKFIALFFVSKLFKFSSTGARNLSLAIIQGSEFAFVMVNLLLQGKILTPEVADPVILVVALSMAMTPVLGLLNDHVLSKRFECPKQRPAFDEIVDENPQVIIAGLGRFGQIVSRILRLKNIAFTALEQDSEQVEALRRFGQVVYYGDASRSDLLEKAGAAKAKYFILAVDDVDSSVKIAEVVRLTYPHMTIFARARNRNHVFQLKNLGVQIIERETFWSSIQLTRQLLKTTGETNQAIETIVQAFAQHDFEMLEGQYQRHHDYDEMVKYSRAATQQVVDVMRDDESLKNRSTEA